MTTRALGMIAVVLLAGMAPSALAAGQESSTYAGSTVSFEVTSDALVEYSVGGTTMAESIRVQSKSETESALSLGASADLGTVVGLPGAALSVDATADANATIESESGATLSAHDDGHASLVVEAGDDAQYVEFGLGANGNASAEAEDRVVVTTEDGTEGTVLVVGDGAVTVNDDGNVTAEVGSESRLVFRSYTDGRTEADRQVETLIADGTAAASVSLSGEQRNVVSYDDETSVAVTEATDGEVAMRVNRTSHDGKVVVTSVAERTYDAVEDLEVQVDGEAAVRADSYGELAAAADGGDRSAFMVTQRSQADASADVLVGINHFSTREVTMTAGGESADGGTSSATTATATQSGDTEGEATETRNDDGNDIETTSGDGPGFGAVAALVALGGAVAVLTRRR